MLYKWLVFLHVLGVMGFMLAHGGTTAMTFLLRRQRDLDRMRALLDLSEKSWPAFAISFLLLFVSGIVAGFFGRWWGEGWIWTSLVILLGMSACMGWASRANFHRLRKVLGLPYFEGGKGRPAIPLASMEEIYAVQATLRPGLVAALGFGSTTAILWLMMFKPF